LGSGTSGAPSSNYLRAAWTPGDLISGFDFAVGGQLWNGTSVLDASATTAPANGVVDTKASALDAQLMGDVSGMPLLVVASYANAPVAGANPNLFNAGTLAKKSFNFGAELGVIPNKATLQLGLRHANAGIVVPGAASGNATDNAIMVGATYNIAMNVRTELTFTKASGDMYNSTQAKASGYLGNSMTTLDVAFGF
jgi:hypothetical protein